jgi:hypothetical protein
MWEFLVIEHRAHIQHAILFSLCVFAWLKGDGPEKWIANVLIGMVVLNSTLHLLFPHDDNFDRIIASHLFLDLIVLAALVPIALRANRIYPLCILAAQLLAVVMHFNRGLAPEGMEFAYWLLTRVPSYIQIIALATGLYLHRRRARRYGPYRSWRTSSHP